MPDSLSLRGRVLLDRPPLPGYIAAHFERVEDLWTPDHPTGYVPLCVAENSLSWDLLLPRLQAAQPPPTSLGYDTMTGSMSFREPLAEFLSRALLGRSVGPDQLAVVAGAGTVLELLFHALADPGDGVLVPTPSYAGFWMDLQTRDALRVVPVHTRPEDDFVLTPALLDAAMDASEAPIRALLFTNPDNPLGRVASPEQVDAVLAWGARRGVHVVVDEVYGLSVFGERPFVSAASRRATLGDHVHLVWAFSKDFGASGLRCGVLVSENEELLRAVDTLAYWGAVSGDTQARLAQLVADREWVDAYVAENQRRLGATSAAVSTELAVQGIPFVPAGAAFFTLCDLRDFLDAPTWEAERTLWRRLLDEAHVNLTPGEACHIVEPGFFRLCWASVPIEGVLAGLRRVGAVLQDRREG